jgi:hypothetical protein
MRRYRSSSGDGRRPPSVPICWKAGTSNVIEDLACAIRIEEAQVVKPGVGCVHYAEAVFARLDFKKRCDLSVDAVEISVGFLDPERMFLWTIDDCGVIE